MKKLSILPIIFTLLLCFGVTQSSPQEKIQLRDFVIVKMIIKKETFEQQIRVPIEKSFDNSKLTGGSFATVDCIDYPLTANNEFYDFAEKINLNKARISVTTNFKNQKSCGYEDKIFIGSRNKTTKLRLRCGVEIIVFYENKTTSN